MSPASAQFAAASLRGRESTQNRAALRTQLKADEVRAADILRDPLPWWLETLEVSKFLGWPYKMHKRVAGSMLRQAGVSEIRRLGELTDRQKAILVDALNLREDARAAKTTPQLLTEKRERMATS